MKFSPEIEPYRDRDRGMFGSLPGDRFGRFWIPFKSSTILVIADPGNPGFGDWEHVSASHHNRCPNWEEMCFLKNLFWDEDETVLQFHPKKSEYVNCHPYCLHLWKKRGHDFELPPSILVGFK